MHGRDGNCMNMFNMKRRDRMENLGVYGRMILKQMCKTQNVTTWTEFIGQGRTYYSLSSYHLTLYNLSY
jgi:hypothetical protein